jgi:transcriptional regulator with PAS, ATPase and Fis domain
VAATNRNLVEEVAQGRFREDLYHRLAVATLYLPPLRDRHGDLGMLVDALLNQVNVEMGGQPGFQRKKLSPGARALLLRHAWPGNVRELKNTLIRAAIWSSGETVGEAGAREALTPQAKMGETALRPLTEGFDIRQVLSEIATHYLTLAMTEANGNKTAAAKLLGLPSYQTLSNWLKKHGIAD